MEPSFKVVLALLSWNRADVTQDNVAALQREAERLKDSGHQTFIAVCDNGSTDGTQSYLQKLEGVQLILNERNVGSAVGRNQLAAYAVEIHADYILFVDCDITVVPGSVIEMLKWYQHNSAASLGANPNRFTDDPNKTTLACPPISEVSESPFRCLTEYGLFPVPVLSAFKFDPQFESGWGCEDNDLAMQIQDKTGLLNYTFDHVCYLHRRPHGSIALMEQEGIDVDGNIRDRYQYMIDKWNDNPKFASLIQWMRHAIALNDLRPPTA